MIDASLQIATVESQPFSENTYVVWLADRTDCVVVDPGFEPAKIVELVDREGLSPAAILNTHGHSDHIAGNGAMKERWPDCPLIIGHGDAPKLSDPQQNLSAGYGFSLTSPGADRTVSDGETIEFAGIEFEVFEIPGHSIGHVVFVWRSGKPGVVLGGDVLFAGSIGRTDFPDGDLESLRDGIHGKLFSLPDDTIVLPGHGPATTVGEEKLGNPYVGVPSGYAM